MKKGKKGLGVTENLEKINISERQTSGLIVVLAPPPALAVVV